MRGVGHGREGWGGEAGSRVHAGVFTLHSNTLEARNKMGPRCRCAVKCTTCFRLEAAVHFRVPVSEPVGHMGALSEIHMRNVKQCDCCHTVRRTRTWSEILHVARAHVAFKSMIMSRISKMSKDVVCAELSPHTFSIFILGEMLRNPKMPNLQQNALLTCLWTKTKLFFFFFYRNIFLV